MGQAGSEVPVRTMKRKSSDGVFLKPLLFLSHLKKQCLGHQTAAFGEQRGIFSLVSLMQYTFFPETSAPWKFCRLSIFFPFLCWKQWTLVTFYILHRNIIFNFFEYTLLDKFWFTANKISFFVKLFQLFWDLCLFV